MKEEYINRLYYLAKLKNYKGTRDEFVEKLQTDDSYFNYALYMARNDKVKYKGTDEEFSIAIGRTKPQSTQSETVATEEKPIAEEPIAKEEVKLEEPVAEEPVIEEKPIAEEPIVEEPIVEEKPAIQVKEVEAPKEEVVKKEIPIGENLIPITDKTEVKAIETPSDKMVVKSEKKEEVKEQPKPEEKPQVEVKDVTEKKSETPKMEESKPDELPMIVNTKDIISIPDELKYKKQPEIEKKEGLYTYDDMKFDLENNPPAFLINKGQYNIDNNIKYEKLSPSEILEKDIFEGKNIKLERNVDLNFPDPPGVVLKKEKIGGKEVYTSYDKKNDKWYFYQEGSDKNNWTEVKSGTIKTMLNSKYKTDKHNTEIDKKSLYVKPKQDDPSKQSEIQRRKSALIYNVYLPYMIQNYDNLTEEQKNKFHKQLFENTAVRTFASNPVDSEYPYSDMWNKVHEIYENEWRKANKGFNKK